MKRHQVVHEFVECIPDELHEGTIYVSLRFRTAVHKCCCGCGREVVTPLSPTDWTLSFDGVSVSLYPSIGNWSFPCQSHYWITSNRVEWAARWGRPCIDAARALDRRAKDQQYVSQSAPKSAGAPAPARPGLFRALCDWFR